MTRSVLIRLEILQPQLKQQRKMRLYIKIRVTPAATLWLIVIWLISSTG